MAGDRSVSCGSTKRRRPRRTGKTEEYLGPLIEAIEGVLKKLPSNEDTEQCYQKARQQLEELLCEKELQERALRAHRSSESCEDPRKDTPYINNLIANAREEHQQAIVATIIDRAIHYQLLGILDLLKPKGPRLGEEAKRAIIEGSQIIRPVACVYSDTAPEYKHDSFVMEFNSQPDSHIEVGTVGPAARDDSEQTAQDQDGIELSPLAVALRGRIHERLEELGINGLVKVKLVPYDKGPSRGTTDILLSTELPTANSEQTPSRQPDRLGRAALHGSVHP